MIGVAVFLLSVGVAGAWAFRCNEKTCQEVSQMIDFVYSDDGDEALIAESQATSYLRHFGYRLIGRKPPYLDRLTGVGQ